MDTRNPAYFVNITLMKIHNSLRFFILIFPLLICSVLIQPSCSNQRKEKWIEVSRDFIPYVSAYTGGVISRAAAIRIELTQPAKMAVNIGQLVENDLFSFSPSVDGKLRWENASTVEFVPNESLKNNQLYAAEFKLGNVADTPEKLNKFEFSFKTIRQGAALNLDFLQTDSENPEKQYLSGFIETADACSAEDLNQGLKAELPGKDLKIEWQAKREGNIYPFLVRGIKRPQKAEKLKIVFDSEVIGAEESFTETVNINPKGEFVINEMRMQTGDETVMQIHFSEPLQPDQVLNGLVKVYGTDKPDVAVNGQVLNVFLKLKEGSNTQVELFPGIASIGGQKLIQGASYFANGGTEKPGVEFLTNGNILPQVKGMTIPFAATHLTKVDVKVIRILESNVPRFLSQNKLSGSSGIRKTGKVVAVKTIRLDKAGPAERGMKQNYNLLLDDLLKTEPGAIYHVELSFRKNYVDLPCLANDEAMETPVSRPDFREMNQAAYYGYDDYYEDEYYYYDDEYSYNWRERDNPCSHSFYAYGHSVSANFISTSVGLMAKQDGTDDWHFYATDLLTGKPLPGVQMQILDYQLQKIATVRTDNNGTAKLEGKLKETPFLLSAAYGQQKSYLRLLRSELRETGSFDVSGKPIKEGLKMFMYTERGVWRPGDTIFMASMIHPESLPENSADMPPLFLQVYNSRGQQIHKEIRPFKPQNTINLFKIPTLESDPTGSYRATLQAGSATFTKYLRVETVLPNRIKMKLDFPDEVIRQSNIDKPVKLQASWLHGMPAGGLRAMVSAVIRPSGTSFKNYENYSFDDPVAYNSSDEFTLFDGTLDQNGLADFYTRIPGERNFAGNLSADFTVRVFEAGGRFSIDRFTKAWMPFSVYTGVKVPKGNSYSGALQTDQQHNLELVAVDDQGKPVAGRNLEVFVYKLETRWWWQSGYQSIRDYYSSYSSIAVRDDIVKTDNRGKAVFSLSFDEEETGAYLVRVCDTDGKHCAGTVFNVAESDFRPVEQEEVKNPRELTVSVDKEKYISGDNVHISFPSPAGGRAHISIEDGLRVIEERWIETSSEESGIDLKSSAAWAPNVYAQVSIFQPHDRRNDLPVRLYGITRINVENEGSRLNPVMNMPAVFRPEKPAEIKVTEKNGRAMDYTIAVVDEGLLDLTRFETPDPWKAMNETEALGVNTWDLYDEVVGKFSGKLTADIKLGGGDGTLNREKTPKANRFTPVVRYLGPFHLNKGASASHKIALPSYYGSVRVMLVASSAEGAWGNAEKTVEVKNPLMLLTTLPRVISPDEEIDLPVNVFALDKNLRNVQVKVTTDKNFSLLSASTSNVKFNGEGDQVVFFRLKAGSSMGTGKISVSATAGSEKAGAETLLEIRSPNPVITRVEDLLLPAGGSWEGNIEAKGLPSTCDARIELSGMPAIDLSSRLKYLTSYPHGCLEQITSSALPQLFIAGLIDLTEKDVSRTEKHVKSVLRRLSEYQNSSGGFSYWPGSRYADEWACSYAGHFICEAKLKGYTVNNDLFKRWKRYQKSQADIWRPKAKEQYDKGMLQAYRLFTLALAGDADQGAMNRLREYPNLAAGSASLLAAAYAQIGQKDAALGMLKMSFEGTASGYNYGMTYGDATRDEAVRLWVLARLGLRSEAAPLARSIASKMGNQSWMSTQTTSWSILAISEFYRDRDAQRIDAIVESDGKTEKYFTNKPLASKALTLGQNCSKQVKITNPNKTELFARIITSGIPGTDYLVPASGGKLRMQVSFTDLSGNPLNIYSINRGTDINITVMVTAAAGSKPGNDLALSMMMPSGWEIENNRVSDMASSVSGNDFIWQDIRDDRVMTYFGMSGGSTKIFRFRVNAAYAGKFYLPAWTCEAMYDDTFNCNTASGNIEIVAPQRNEVQ